MRAVKGLGIDNCAAIVRVFKTPFLLHMCYSQLPQDAKICENLLTAAKLELQKNQKEDAQDDAEEVPQNV